MIGARMEYEIRLDNYEGPFNLLLTLVNRKKIDVYEIPLARIVQEFLTYITTTNYSSLDKITDFLLVATHLLKLKATGLIVDNEASEDETEVLVDSIEERLALYQRYKTAGEWLKRLMAAEAQYFSREAGIEEDFIKFVPNFLTNIKPPDLAEIYLKLLEVRKLDASQARYIAPAPLRLDIFMKRILKKLILEGNQTFKELTSFCRNKVEIIASFLALLELYKQSKVDIIQAETFGNIYIKSLASKEVVYEPV
jgi:segregation and condensation protein A